MLLWTDEQELLQLGRIGSAAEQHCADAVPDPRRFRVRESAPQFGNGAAAIAFRPILENGLEPAHPRRPRATDATIVIGQHRNAMLGEVTCKAGIVRGGNTPAAIDDYGPGGGCSRCGQKHHAAQFDAIEGSKPQRHFGREGTGWGHDASCLAKTRIYTIHSIRRRGGPACHRQCLGSRFNRYPPGWSSISQPAVASFGIEDILTTSMKAASGTDYSAGAQTGLSVPVNAARDLWLRLDMPLSTTTTAQQQMNVSVTAVSP